MLVSTLETDVEVDADRTSAFESLQGVVETSVGEDRRMDAARNLPQLVGHCDEIVRETRQLLRSRLVPRGEAGGLPRPQRECDGPLLDAVMEVALEPTAAFIGGRDDTRT
jgi:hypothetical protein